MFKIIISKRADLLAKLYDLYHAPQIQENLPYHILYIGDLSEIVYYGYVFEKYSLWDKLFDTLIEKKNDYEAKKYLENLDKVNLYKWDLIEAELGLFSEKFTKMYNDYNRKIRDMLSKILPIKKYFEEEYLILGFNPGRGVLGSTLRINLEEKYIVNTLFIGINTTPEKSLDLYIHELLHGLIRLNNINIPDEVEEEFISTLCPEGYLSELLGLSETINVSEGSLQAYIHSYFAEKMYEKMDLLKYLELKAKNHYM
ncbi:MAG: hypothetical protein J7L82_03240 [Staphylothermus sp.]|nr:hypothetical protein [Staphylothermus sp.]